MTFFNKKPWQLPAAIVIFIMVTISWWSLDTGHKVGGLFSDISNITEIDAVGKNTISSLKLSDVKLAKGNKNNKELKGQKENISEISKKKGMILFWNSYYLTRTIGLGKVLTVHYDCGEYQCNVTRDRSYLNRSHVIMFNPRTSKGKLMYVLNFHAAYTL